MDSVSHDLIGKIVRPKKNSKANWGNNFTDKEAPWGHVVALWKRADDRLMVAVRIKNGEMGEFYLTDLAMGRGD
jgi:hypothetical protein